MDRRGHLELDFGATGGIVDTLRPVGERPAVAPPMPELVEGAVGDDPVEPRSEGRFTSERVDVAIRAALIRRDEALGRRGVAAPERSPPGFIAVLPLLLPARRPDFSRRLPVGSPVRRHDPAPYVLGAVADCGSCLFDSRQKPHRAAIDERDVLQIEHDAKWLVLWRSRQNSSRSQISSDRFRDASQKLATSSGATTAGRRHPPASRVRPGSPS